MEKDLKQITLIISDSFNNTKELLKLKDTKIALVRIENKFIKNLFNDFNVYGTFTTEMGRNLLYSILKDKYSKEYNKMMNKYIKEIKLNATKKRNKGRKTLQTN